MKRYTETSAIYEGMAKSFFYIEGSNDCELNNLIRGNSEYIVLSLQHKGIEVKHFDIVPSWREETPFIKDMILRQLPALDAAALEKIVEEVKTKESKGRLLFVNSAGYDLDGNFEADIICEDDFGNSMPEYASRLDAILDAIATLQKEQQSIGTTRYRLPLFDDEDEKKIEDNKECLYNDLLAGSLCQEKEKRISPILFDKEFNISLPLYPQVVITLEPLPKTLYILFLQHPEGIVLKDLYLYENEMKKIYRLVSGRRNPTVINRMFRTLIDPTDNPLHKNLSIIRRSFTSKLNYEIARNYIPAHGRTKAHNIPLESEYIILPDIA